MRIKTVMSPAELVRNERAEMAAMLEDACAEVSRVESVLTHARKQVAAIEACAATYDEWLSIHDAAEQQKRIDADRIARQLSI